MALESATYINGLNSSNPTAGDPVSQGDDHLRLLKSTVKASFPNIAGAMSLSHTQLNLLDTKLLAGNGYQKLPSGLILQWGSGNTGVGSSVVVTFPVAFASAAYQVLVSNSTSSTAGLTLCAVSPTTTQVTVASSSPSLVFSWFAIGV